MLNNNFKIQIKANPDAQKNEERLLSALSLLINFQDLYEQTNQNDSISKNEI